MSQSDRTSFVADAAARAPAREGRHPATFAPATLILIVVLSVFGAVIGVQLIVQLGVTPNTSIIGALVAMILAWVPLALFARYRLLLPIGVHPRHACDFKSRGFSNAANGRLSKRVPTRREAAGSQGPLLPPTGPQMIAPNPGEKGAFNVGYSWTIVGPSGRLETSS